MTLTTYHNKRKFSATPEPKGSRHTKAKKLIFVIQKHDATRLHYDFRLELDGVLKSWAVPKGPSLNPADKHLAMMVEDHPYDYRTFEGIIPEGNYGAGSVIVWDEGTYTSLEPVPKGMTEQAFLLDQLEKGSLKIVMSGHKLKGEFALFRFKRAGENAWLLMKHNDNHASTSDILANDTSVISGLTVEQIAEGKGVTKAQRAAVQKKLQEAEIQKEKKVVHLAQEEGKKAPLPQQISPMLAQSADIPFDNPEWIFEFKWDGYRAIAQVEKGAVRLYSRNNQEFNRKFPTIVTSLEKIKHTLIFDGEIVVLDEHGRSRFQYLQDYQERQSGQLAYYIFDLLYLDGVDLRGIPLIERKKLLKNLLGNDTLLRFSEHVAEAGLKLYAIAKRKGYEGIMAKKKTSSYSSNRTSDWLKLKNILTSEAVIAGFTKPRGKREEFGALILGLYDNNELRYIGHAGGGFDHKKLKEVYNKLEPLITDHCPFPVEPATNNHPTWVKPKLVCQVKYSEWTSGGIMRQPVFLGLREDKEAKEVSGETPSLRRQAHSPVRRGLAQLTNLDKVYWPDQGYTKGDLLDYYEKIADYILPHLKDRPISLNRFPNGITGESFFQKDLVHKPDWVKTVPIFSEHDQRDLNWLICNNKDTLLYIANLGSIEINPWNSRYTHPNNPDYLIIDLDPEGISFQEVIKTARVVRELLEAIAVDCFLKTSGKTGLHIFVPLRAKYTYEQTQQFAQILATKVFTTLPDTTSILRDPKKREHKIYIDFLQNREGQTIAAPYCVRPIAYAPVSTPLDWQELQADLSPLDYTIKTIFRRLGKKGDIWEKFRNHTGINMRKSLKKLSEL